MVHDTGSISEIMALLLSNNQMKHIKASTKDLSIHQPCSAFINSEKEKQVDQAQKKIKWLPLTWVLMP